jgi:hypothetical protein
LSADDGTVPPSNGINYFSALLEHGVPASLHDNEGTVRHSDEPKMQANNYYVSSTGRTADFDNPGDTIRFYGSVTDEVIDNPGIGSCSRPIVFMEQ